MPRLRLMIHMTVSVINFLLLLLSITLFYLLTYLLTYLPTYLSGMSTTIKSRP